MEASETIVPVVSFLLILLLLPPDDDFSSSLHRNHECWWCSPCLPSLFDVDSIRSLSLPAKLIKRSREKMKQREREREKNKEDTKKSVVCHQHQDHYYHHQHHFQLIVFHLIRRDERDSQNQRLKEWSLDWKGRKLMIQENTEERFLYHKKSVY